MAGCGFLCWGASCPLFPSGSAAAGPAPRRRRRARCSCALQRARASRLRRRGARPLGAAGARPLMAKRRAETLMCHVPVKRLLREPALPRAGERRSRAEPGCAGPAAPKRPLEEAEAPPGKRLGPRAPRAQPEAAGGGRRRRGGTAEPRDAVAEEGRAGGGGEERTAAEAKEVSSTFTGPSPAPPHEMDGKHPLHLT
ncbi:uncharacterized protein FYW23_014712 [Sylvia borin]